MDWRKEGRMGHGWIERKNEERKQERKEGREEGIKKKG